MSGTRPSALLPFEQGTSRATLRFLFVIVTSSPELIHSRIRGKFCLKSPTEAVFM